MERSPGSSEPAAGRRVVLADDDPLIRTAIGDVLRAAGYAVHPAGDGLSALALIRAVQPDAIVLDVMLPKLDGGRVCAAVKRDPRLRAIPIIVFSALGLPDYRHFPGLTADGYVAKGPLPVAAGHLLTALQHLAGRGTEPTELDILGHEAFPAHRIVSELLLERRHLRAILQMLAPGALEVDREGRIVWANPGACASFGKPEAVLVGEPLAALAPPASQARLQALLTELMGTGAPGPLTTPLVLHGKAVSVRLLPIVEEQACTGLLLLLEGEATIAG